MVGYDISIGIVVLLISIYCDLANIVALMILFDDLAQWQLRLFSDYTTDYTRRSQSLTISDDLLAVIIDNWSALFATAPATAFINCDLASVAALMISFHHQLQCLLSSQAQAQQQQQQWHQKQQQQQWSYFIISHNASLVNKRNNIYFNRLLLFIDSYL